jgi:HAE1 family hydrophobic/amphiphilic exporter-1
MEFTDTKTREAEVLVAPGGPRYMVAVVDRHRRAVEPTNMFVSMKPKGERGIDPKAGYEPSQQELMAVTRKALKELDLKVSIQICRSAVYRPRGFPVELRCRGVTGTSWWRTRKRSSRSSMPQAWSPTPTAITCWASRRSRSSRIVRAPPSAA